MNRSVALLRWELVELLRRGKRHPVVLATVAAGLPVIMALYGLFGSWIADGLVVAHGRGPEAFDAALTLRVRAFALLLLAMGGAITAGNLFHQRPRELLARHRTLPLTDGELYGVRRASEDGGFAVLVLLPVLSVVALRLLAGGVDPLLAFSLLVAALLLAFTCGVFVRVALLGFIWLFPGRALSWRAGLWVAIGVVSLLVRPIAVFAGSLWEQTEAAVFPPTDWIGVVARAWMEDDLATALGLLFMALAVAAAGLALDFRVFRELCVRRHDALFEKLSGGGLTSGRVDFVASLLDKLPARIAGRPVRAFVRKDLLRLVREPSLSLALQVPILVVALSFAAIELTLHGSLGPGPPPPDLGSWTRRATGVTLAFLACGGAGLHAALVAAWEGPGLAALRPLPLDERQLVRAKELPGAVVLAATWLPIGLFAAATLRPESVAPRVAWVGFPAAALLAIAVTARVGTLVGRTFARSGVRNALLALGLSGTAVQLGFSGLAIGSAALLAVGPGLAGARLALLALPLLACWLFVLVALEREAPEREPEPATLSRSPEARPAPDPATSPGP